MAKDAKLIRGQVRQIVKEILPEVLKVEFAESIRKELTEQLRASMVPLDADVRLSMDNLNKRYQELASYILRQFEASVAPVVPEAVPPTETL